MSPHRYAVVRQRMVDQQLSDIRDERVRASLAAVPRHCFVPSILQGRAYEDGPLPIDKRQTISQPWIVARMTELLELKGDEKVLEIGTGSGYQTAVLAPLCGRVISVERHGELAKTARKRLEKLGVRNVTVLAGDGTMGRSEFAPFDAILVTAGAPDIPGPLLSQLKPGGVLVIPIGDEATQELVRVRGPLDPESDAEPAIERFGACRFVPLLGRFGWKDPR